MGDADLLVPAAGLEHGVGPVAGTGSVAVGRLADNSRIQVGGWGEVPSLRLPHPKGQRHVQVMAELVRIRVIRPMPAGRCSRSEAVSNLATTDRMLRRLTDEATISWRDLTPPDQTAIPG